MLIKIFYLSTKTEISALASPVIKRWVHQHHKDHKINLSPSTPSTPQPSLNSSFFIHIYLNNSPCPSTLLLLSPPGPGSGRWRVKVFSQSKWTNQPWTQPRDLGAQWKLQTGHWRLLPLQSLLSRPKTAVRDWWSIGLTIQGQKELQHCSALSSCCHALSDSGTQTGQPREENQRMIEVRIWFLAHVTSSESKLIMNEQKDICKK